MRNPQLEQQYGDGICLPNPAHTGLGSLDQRQMIRQWQNTPKVKYGFGDTDDSSGINWGDFLKELPSNIRQIWTAYTQAELQSQLLELNIQRAAQGLPMVKMPGISVGADTTTLLVVGGIGAAIAVAIFAGGRGKRR